MSVPVLKMEQYENYKIKTNDKKLVVKFFATWCGPCQMLAPIFEDISKELSSDADFVSVNIDQSADLAKKFGITSIPAIIIIKNEKEINRNIGFIDSDSLKNFIKKS